MGVEVLHGAGPPAPGDRWAGARLQPSMGRTVTFGPRLRPMALINLSFNLTKFHLNDQKAQKVLGSSWKGRK